MIGHYRLLLALGVFFSHVAISRFPLGFGRAMVSAFFVLSGYLIALTLNRNYDSIAPFYWNRALRIYPLHIVVCAAAVILIAAGIYERPLPDVPTAILGLALDPKSAYELNPPAWTLGYELLFYLVAPFVVYHAWRMIGVIVVCVSVLISLGRIDLLTHSFMLTGGKFEVLAVFASLPLFMLGGLIYKLPYRFNNLQMAAIIGLALCFLCKNVFWPVMIFTILLLLGKGKESSASKMSGDLCYPVYMIHWVVLYTTGPLMALPVTAALALAFVWVEKKLLSPNKMPYRQTLPICSSSCQSSHSSPPILSSTRSSS